MSGNNQSNRLIKWIVMAGDFAVLNAYPICFRGLLDGESKETTDFDGYLRKEIGFVRVSV